MPAAFAPAAVPAMPAAFAPAAVPAIPAAPAKILLITFGIFKDCDSAIKIAVSSATLPEEYSLIPLVSS